MSSYFSVWITIAVAEGFYVVMVPNVFFSSNVVYYFPPVRMMFDIKAYYTAFEYGINYGTDYFKLIIMSSTTTVTRCGCPVVKQELEALQGRSFLNKELFICRLIPPVMFGECYFFELYRWSLIFSELISFETHLFVFNCKVFSHKNSKFSAIFFAQLICITESNDYGRTKK